MPNVDLGFGRIKEIKLNLKLFKDVQAWMFSVMQFHLFTVFGKKLFLYLVVLQGIYRGKYFRSCVRT